MKSRKVKVCGVWFTRRWTGDKFVREADYLEGELMDASIGEKRITVWLPSGKRVASRIGIWGLNRTFLAHAWNDRFGDLREIKCTILDWPVTEK